jgi:ferric-dicitrate binding protein FerR (iron transport regulator)
MHNSTQIEETAANWLARRDGEGWSAADQAEWTVWLGASTAHRVAYIRLEAAWQRARRLKALAADTAFGEAPVWRFPQLSDRRRFPVSSDTPASVSNATKPPERS